MFSLKESLDRIDSVYDRVKKNGMTFGDHIRKEKLSDRTIQTYRDVTKAYMNYLNKNYGITDITRAKPKHAYAYMEKQIDRYQSNDPNASAYTMRRFAHALHAFFEGSKATGVFKGKVKVGDKRKILGMINDAGILRKSEESKTLKASHEDWKKVQKEIENSRFKNKKEIADIHLLQRKIGTRITENIELKKNNITFNADSSATVEIKGKGGLVRFNTTTDKQVVKMLRERTENKKSAAPVFQVKGVDGNDKDKKNAATKLKQSIRDAAKRADVDRDGKKYTSHSARKAFAQTRMNGYYKMSKNRLKKEVGKHCSDKDLKRKYDQTMKNIRSKIRKENRSKREMTHKELCQWLTSVDLGHGRLDVIRYYADYPGKK